MLFEHVQIALEALSRHPLRNGLSMLGIVIAVAAVITLVALGVSTRAEIDAQIQALGSNQVIVTPGPQPAGPGAGSRIVLTGADAYAIEQEVAGIAVAAATIGTKVQVIAGGRNHVTTLQGAGASYLEARGWRMAEGRMPTLEEQRLGARVGVLGSTVAERLFGGQPPLGLQLRVGRVPIEVIGVLASRGSNSAAAEDQNDLIITPLTTARQRLVGHHPAISDSVDFIVASIREDANVETVKAQIRDVMKQRHRLAPAAEDAFRILGMTEQLEFRMAAAERLNQLLLAIASVSLLVGGVGIMNVMLISVTERTREIGLRRAMGARRRDVLAQILVEAAALSVIGGAIGVLIAFAASSALSALAGMPITLDVGIGAFALLFSGGIGVAFGFYPAWRASVQEPIEALRHE